MGEEMIEIIKIGGPTATVVLLFLIYMDRSDKRHVKLMENHMEHNTAAVNQNTKVLAKLATVISVLGKTLKGKVIYPDKRT